MADEPYKEEEIEVNETCHSCGRVIYIHEVEVLNMFYEVGGYCDNKKCPRYKLLTA